MQKNNQRFAHGEHNERLCNLLEVKQEFPDWTITTAFYAALHFVTYKIFPFKLKVMDRQKEFHSFEEWCYHKSYTEASRHEILKNLVADHCPAIHPEYDWLLSLAWTSRYHNYQHDKPIVDRAVSNMRKIKKFCQY